MPSVFGCIPSGSRCGNGPNELVHRAGPLFLDNHYRGYQYIMYMYSVVVNVIPIYGNGLQGASLLVANMICYIDSHFRDQNMRSVNSTAQNGYKECVNNSSSRSGINL